jgi:hypothetical protein
MFIALRVGDSYAVAVTTAHSEKSVKRNNKKIVDPFS